MPYQKGQSGNPAGRPKGSINVIDRLREKLESERVADQYTEKLYKLAMQNKDGKLALSSIDSQLDRLYGKASQQVQSTHSFDEKTIQILLSLPDE